MFLLTSLVVHAFLYLCLTQTDTMRMQSLDGTFRACAICDPHLLPLVVKYPVKKPKDLVINIPEGHINDCSQHTPINNNIEWVVQVFGRWKKILAVCIISVCIMPCSRRMHQFMPLSATQTTGDTRNPLLPSILDRNRIPTSA